MESMLNRLLEWMPILVIIGGALAGLARWILKLKSDIRDAHVKLHSVTERVNDIEARQLRFEDKIDLALTEVHRRIDDCKNSILENIKIVLQAVSKN